jgi:hypothetical protein
VTVNADYVLGRQPATRYLNMEPGLETQASVQREIMRDLRDCAWIILWQGGYWFEPNASQRPGSPLLERFIQSHYRLAMHNASYQVYRRAVTTD